MFLVHLKILLVTHKTYFYQSSLSSFLSKILNYYFFFQSQKEPKMQKGQFPSRQISDTQVKLLWSLHTRPWQRHVSCLCLPTVWSTSPGLLVWPPPFSSPPTSGPLKRGESVELKCQTIYKNNIFWKTVPSWNSNTSYVRLLLGWVDGLEMLL